MLYDPSVSLILVFSRGVLRPRSQASSESKYTLRVGSCFLSTYYASRALQTLHAKKIPSIFFFYS